MRTLEKNKRLCYYANPTGVLEEVIVDGDYTGEFVPGYGTKTALKVNFSASRNGDYETEPFGDSTNYDRTMVFANKSCPFKEGTKVWINSTTANYRVIKIADSPNGCKVALQEIK